MHQLRHYLDVTANGINQAWKVMYGPTAWETVLRGSADTQYLQSDTLGHRSDFDCGVASIPSLGFVAAITVHYRVRSTDTVGAPDLIVDALDGGVQLTAGQTVVPVAAVGWTDGEYRIEVDAVTGARFAPGVFSDLGVMVEVTTAPTTGYLDVSHLWLEIEWVRTPLFYDPVTFAATPDAIVGDMAWTATGAQPAAIVGNALVLTDASAVDWRAYQYTIPEYGVDYVTEVTTRFSLVHAAGVSAFVYRIVQVDDGTYSVDLCCFQDAVGVARVGFITGALDRNDPTAYFVSAAVDWTQDHHYRLVIDRATDLDTTQRVRLYVDYAAVPTLEEFYTEFTGTAAAGSLEFGTGFAGETAAQPTATISYLDWWSYRKEGDWRHWYTLGVGNNVVVIDTTDTFIAVPVLVTPPGIWTGQSERCCQLQVASLAVECSAWTYLPTPDPVDLYTVTVDYRVDTLATDAKLTVQRTSDHWYWNNGASAWQAAAADTTLTYSPTRTRSIEMTDLTNTANDQFIIKVLNDIAAAAAHSVYIYKVDFRAQ